MRSPRRIVMSTSENCETLPSYEWDRPVPKRTGGVLEVLEELLEERSAGEMLLGDEEVERGYTFSAIMTIIMTHDKRLRLRIGGEVGLRS